MSPDLHVLRGSMSSTRCSLFSQKKSIQPATLTNDRQVETRQSYVVLPLSGTSGLAGSNLQGRQRVIKLRAEPILRKPGAPKPRKEGEDEATVEVAEEPVVDSPVIADEVQTSGITIEFQRQQARAMVEYFENQMEEEVAQRRFFGWTLENEIGNGRWVMFGILVGFITEYVTGVSFWDQIKLIITYLGIADVYEY